MTGSKVPADANRAVVYMDGERIADTKTPKPTRGDLVRGKYGNGKFRIDYLEGKFSVGSEMLVVDLPIEEYRPSEKPAPEPVPPPVIKPAQIPPESIGQSIQRAIDAKICELRERCAEFRSAIDLYEHAAQQAIRTRAALHNGLVRPESDYRDGDEIEAARILSELIAAIVPQPAASPPATLAEAAQRLAEIEAPVPTPLKEPMQAAPAPMPKLSIVPRKATVVAAPEAFADKIAAVGLPYPNLLKRLNESKRSVLIIGGQVDPPKLQEVAAMLSLPVERVVWPATTERNNHAAVSAESSVKNGKFEAIFVLDHLLGHDSVLLLRRAATARGIPLELVGKGGTGRFRVAIAHVESLLEGRKAQVKNE